MAEYKSNPEKFKRPKSPGADKSKTKNIESRFFKKDGKCKFGDKCIFKHDGVVPGVVALDFGCMAMDDESVWSPFCLTDAGDACGATGGGTTERYPGTAIPDPAVGDLGVWTRKESRSRPGIYYYHNEETGESRYHLPKEKLDKYEEDYFPKYNFSHVEYYYFPPDSATDVEPISTEGEQFDSLDPPDRKTFLGAFFNCPIAKCRKLIKAEELEASEKAQMLMAEIDTGERYLFKYPFETEDPEAVPVAPPPGNQTECGAANVEVGSLQHVQQLQRSLDALLETDWIS